MSSRFIFIYNRPNVFSQTGSHQFCGDGWQGRCLPDAGTGRPSKVIIHPQRKNLSSILMLILADCRDLPPPPPQFDDPPPATGLDQFGRGSKFKKQKLILSLFHLQYFPGEYTTLTTLDTASYPGYQLGSSPTRFQAETPFSISSPSFYTGTPTITQVAICCCFS